MNKQMGLSVAPIISIWTETLGPVNDDICRRLSEVVSSIPIENVYRAISITASKNNNHVSYNVAGSIKKLKYFNGILRNWENNEVV